MSKTNCPNCGGELDIFAPKCKYCGTKNINITDIDLASGEAANFIFRLPHNIVDANGNEVYMSVLAVPELDAMQVTSDYSYVTGSLGAKYATYETGRNLDISLNLRAVPAREKNVLYYLTSTPN